MGATSKKSIERKRKSKQTFLIIVVAILTILLAFVGYIYWTRFQEIEKHRQELLQLKEKKKRLLEENAELRQKLNKKNDLDYIAKLAYRKLGFIFPEENNKEGTD